MIKDPLIIYPFNQTMGRMNYNIENETHFQLNSALDNLVVNLAWIISAN